MSKGYPVHGTTRQPTGARLANVDSLGIGNRVAIYAMNPRDADTVNALVRAVRPHEVFNLTGPSSVGYSFAITEGGTGMHHGMHDQHRGHAHRGLWRGATCPST